MLDLSVLPDFPDFSLEFQSPSPLIIPTLFAGDETPILIKEPLLALEPIDLTAHFEREGLLSVVDNDTQKEDKTVFTTPIVRPKRVLAAGKKVGTVYNEAWQRSSVAEAALKLLKEKIRAKTHHS